MSVVSRVTLGLREGSSDKAYQVVVIRAAPEAGRFNVLASWGRRGGPYCHALKATGVSFESAEARARKLVADKRKKGYTSDDASRIDVAQFAGAPTGPAPGAGAPVEAAAKPRRRLSLGED